MFQHPTHRSMAGFMVCNGFFLFRGDDLVFFLEPSYDPVNRIQEILLVYRFLFFSGGDQGGLVAYIGDVGPGKSRGLPGQKFQIQRFCRFIGRRWTSKISLRSLMSGRST